MYIDGLAINKKLSYKHIKKILILLKFNLLVNNRKMHLVYNCNEIKDSQSLSTYSCTV